MDKITMKMLKGNCGHNRNMSGKSVLKCFLYELNNLFLPLMLMDHGHAKLSYHEKNNQVASCWIPYHPPKESSPKISILPYIIISYVQIQLFVPLMHRPGGPTCSFNLFSPPSFPNIRE